MINHFLLRYLARRWRGPLITVNDQTGATVANFGQGTDSPAATITIRSPRVWRRLAFQPLSLAFGEAYRRGEIVIGGDLMAVLQGFYQSQPLISPALTTLRRMLPVSSSPRQAIAKAQHHYDVGDDFYRLWLDESLTYSCAFFRHEDDSLERAQQQKLELICRKLRLQPGHTLLDIGCGWGSLLFKAVGEFGVRHALGITASANQALYIKQKAARRGISTRVTVMHGDWRQLKQRPDTFDRIVSVGFFEHVGRPRYRQFFRLHHHLLAPTGRALLHTIGHLTPTVPDAFITKYIFPGGSLPTLQEIVRYITDAGLAIADIENLRPHYALTLRHWYERFKQHHAVIEHKLGAAFTRTWELYLQGAQAGFRWGDLHLFQVVLLGPRAPWPLKSQRRPTSVY